MLSRSARMERASIGYSMILASPWRFPLVYIFPL
jgi:hypothetical protein